MGGYFGNKLNALKNLLDAENVRIKKAVLKRTADVLEKLGIAGMALGIFQGRADGMWWGFFFLTMSYAFSIWEARI